VSKGQVSVHCCMCLYCACMHQALAAPNQVYAEPLRRSKHADERSVVFGSHSMAAHVSVHNPPAANQCNQLDVVVVLHCCLS
jgi:hypothetical protein